MFQSKCVGVCEWSTWMRGRFVTAALWIFMEIKTPRGAHCTMSQCWDSHLDPQCQHITWQQDGCWIGEGGVDYRTWGKEGADDGLQHSWANLTPGWVPQFPPSSSGFTHTSSRGGRRRAVAGKNHLCPHVDLQPNAHRDKQTESDGGGALSSIVLMGEK